MGGYYGLQAAGMDAGMAGNWVQLTVFCFLCFGWVGSYVWRVANKEMSYVKQLEAYEDAVMAKRLEEMPEAERARLLSEVDAARAAAAAMIDTSTTHIRSTRLAIQKLTWRCSTGSPVA